MVVNRQYGSKTLKQSEKIFLKGTSTSSFLIFQPIYKKPEMWRDDSRRLLNKLKKSWKKNTDHQFCQDFNFPDRGNKTPLFYHDFICKNPGPASSAQMPFWACFSIDGLHPNKSTRMFNVRNFSNLTVWVSILFAII